MLTLSNPGGSMAKHHDPGGIPLPNGWPQRVRSALLHVVALAQFGLAYSRSWAVKGRIARVRLKAENDQLRQEMALLTEESARPGFVHGDHWWLVNVRSDIAGPVAGDATSV
jgi:hypothetical protein